MCSVNFFTVQEGGGGGKCLMPTCVYSMSSFPCHRALCHCTLPPKHEVANTQSPTKNVQDTYICTERGKALTRHDMHMSMCPWSICSRKVCSWTMHPLYDNSLGRHVPRDTCCQWACSLDGVIFTGHYLCRMLNGPMWANSWTAGCNVYVCLMQYRQTCLIAYTSCKGALQCGLLSDDLSHNVGSRKYCISYVSL